MKKILGALRSPWVRGLFLVAAIGAAVLAVANQWDIVVDSLSQMPWWIVVVGLLVSVLYVVATMLSWREVLIDLGSRLGLAPAARLFFVSQVGKYLPGGVWNIVAAAEMGKDIDIPRRRSVSGMVVSLLVSIVTGLALAAGAVAFDPAVRSEVGWVVWFLPVFVVVLLPPVLNRILGVALKLIRRPPLEHPLSARGVLRASSWAIVGWLLAGLQVWLIATAVGLDPTLGTFARAVSGYALAWVVGFLVVIVPAGVGVRESILGIMLAGLLSGGGVLVTILMSRVLLTVVDLALGLGTGVLVRRHAPQGAAEVAVDEAGPVPVDEAGPVPADGTGSVPADGDGQPER
ncbi:lysylphosphatidylglycerol synthase domain-containing protein [Georgenia sp. Z1344]|uniref:lysylphosphatidylglycerol synthase domain-containing protein n=1 Tax=Georgenia sp. Z1344 TaxID=3416706 RepID=UPI003CEA7A08